MEVLLIDDKSPYIIFIWQKAQTHLCVLMVKV